MLLVIQAFYWPIWYDKWELTTRFGGLGPRKLWGERYQSDEKRKWHCSLYPVVKLNCMLVIQLTSSYPQSLIGIDPLVWLISSAWKCAQSVHEYDLDSNVFGWTCYRNLEPSKNVFCLFIRLVDCELNIITTDWPNYDRLTKKAFLAFFLTRSRPRRPFDMVKFVFRTTGFVQLVLDYVWSNTRWIQLALCSLHMATDERCNSKFDLEISFFFVFDLKLT